MAEILPKLRTFLKRNKGELKTKDFEVVANMVDVAQNELTDASKQEIARLICEAFSITEEELKDRMELGSMALERDYVDDFLPLVPPDGLLRTYIEYTMKTESPTAFHLFSFLTVLGAILGRQVFIDQEVFKIWPNLAVILIGPSGRVHKTTAADFSIDLAQEAAGIATGDAIQVGSPRFDLLAEKGTSEAVHSALARKDPATGLMYAPELTTVLNRRDYNKDLIKDLTRLWDCPGYLPVRTLSRDREVLRNVALSFLGCTNETWLVELPPDAFKGGFMARILSVYQPATDRYFPRPKKLDKALKEELLVGLVETEKCVGPATLTRLADKYYCKRYRELKRNFPADERIAPFFQRVPDHMLRLGLLLSICEHRTENVFIEDYHLKQADALLKQLLSWLPKVYAFLGVSTVGEDSRRILFTMLKNGGRISRPALIRSMIGRLTVRQLDDRLLTLKQGRVIRQVEGGLFDEGGRTTTYYKLLKRPEDIA